MNLTELQSFLEYRKNTNRKTLYENQWISIKQIDTEGGKYTFLHENRCEGIIVVVLLYKKTNDGFLYGIRKETVPPWYNKPIVCSLTGGLENKKISETVIKEIKEESGYDLSMDDLKTLDFCFGTKSTDTIYILFCADVTNKVQGKKSGDGTKYDTEASFDFVTGDDIVKSYDPILITLYCKFLSSIITN